MINRLERSRQRKEGWKCEQYSATKKVVPHGCAITGAMWVNKQSEKYLSSLA